jgi:glycosyltransferase involved in cell wall biosynthesis
LHKLSKVKFINYSKIPEKPIMTDPDKTKPTIIQYLSVLPGSGGGSHVMASIAEELVAHGYPTVVVIGGVVDRSKQYARFLKGKNIPVLGVDSRSAKLVHSLLTIPVLSVRLFFLLPYMAFKRKGLVDSWKKLGEEIGYALRGRILLAWAAKKTIDNLETMIENGSGILHVHYLGWPQCIAVLRWAKRKEIRTVLHYHYDVSFTQRRIHRFFFDKYREFLSDRSTIIVLSEGLRKSMTEHIGPDFGIGVVPNWVKVESLESIGMGKAEGPLKICTVARSVGGKGIEDVLRAMVTLAEKRAEVIGTVIGSGMGHDYLVDTALRLGVDDRITFTGELSEIEVTETLKLHDVFILVSSSEGMSIVLLKAMALGLPVIVTPAGANREIVESAQNGFLVEIGNVGQLTAAILSLAADPELRRRMGEKSKIFCKQNFSREAVWPKLETVYKRFF